MRAAEVLRTEGVMAAATPRCCRPEPETATQTASWESVLAGVMQNKGETQTAIEAMREAQEVPVHTRHLLDIVEAFWWREVVPKIDEQITARLSPREAERYMADPERPVLLDAASAAREIAGQPIEQQLDRITGPGVHRGTVDCGGPARAPGKIGGSRMGGDKGVGRADLGPGRN